MTFDGSHITNDVTFCTCGKIHDRLGRYAVWRDQGSSGVYQRCFDHVHKWCPGERSCGYGPCELSYRTFNIPIWYFRDWKKVFASAADSVRRGSVGICQDSREADR